ncbi:MAG: porphobilinogen synthase [Holophagaceae bacterium]
MAHRSRRLRLSPAIRELIAETRIHSSQFVQPHFVQVADGSSEIASLPGIERMSIQNLLLQVEKDLKIGVRSVLLFGIPEVKTPNGLASQNKEDVIPKAIRALKKNFGSDLIVMSDICLCAYTDHGHCGLVVDSKIHNQSSVEALAAMALNHAEAGVDIVAPSDMMDFRIKAIRDTLDANNFQDVSILSYAIKHAGAYYGPFRDAADSSPRFGDRKSYQMDPRNVREGLRDALQDIDEGADFLMIKPALPNLDLISKLREMTLAPLFAYHVSSEYSSVKAADARGWVLGDQLMREHLISIKRSGADVIVSYAAREALLKGWFS